MIRYKTRHWLCTRYWLSRLVYYRLFRVDLMVLDSAKALGIELTRYNKGHWLYTRYWLYHLVYFRLFRMDCMAVDIGRASGIDSAGYLTWNGLCTRYWLYILVYCRYLKVAFMVLDQQRHLASTWLGITKGIDYVQGTDYIVWLTIGISRWHSWFWVQQRHLASTWLGITLGSNYIQGTDYIVWWMIGYIGWISRLWITKGIWHQFKLVFNMMFAQFKSLTTSFVYYRLLKWGILLTVDSRCASNGSCKFILLRWFLYALSLSLSFFWHAGTECKWNWIS